MALWASSELKLGLTLPFLNWLKRRAEGFRRDSRLFPAYYSDGRISAPGKIVSPDAIGLLLLALERSVAAGEAPLTEKDWNDRAIEPYARAKMEAERQAWDFARETGLNLVTVLPGSIIGPGFHRHTPTTIAFELLLRGKVPVVLPLAFTFVDVRDVARAHLLAYENPAASGRYIVSDRSCSMAELFAMVAEVDPTVPVPKARLSERLLPLVPVLDWLGNRLAGTPRFASRAMIREYGRRLQLVSSDRIRAELGWKPMDLKASIRDTLEWTRSRFIDTAREQDGAVHASRTPARRTHVP